MDDFGSHSVELFIYDMTQGMASMMSPLLLGKYLWILIEMFRIISTRNHRNTNEFSVSASQVGKSMEFGIQLWLFSVVNISSARKELLLVHPWVFEYLTFSIGVLLVGVRKVFGFSLTIVSRENFNLFWVNTWRYWLNISAWLHPFTNYQPS